MTRSALLWTLLLLPAGCNLPNLDTDPLVVLGTGEVEFEALAASGNELELINGLQGGQHVWGSFRATGVDWRQLNVQFSLLDETGASVTGPSRTIAECVGCADQDGCDQGMGELVGFPVLVDEPALVLNRNLVLRVEVEDEEGRDAVDERGITVHR